MKIIDNLNQRDVFTKKTWVDEMVVDEVGVGEKGVDEMGSRRSGMTLFEPLDK